MTGGRERDGGREEGEKERKKEGRKQKKEGGRKKNSLYADILPGTEKELFLVCGHTCTDTYDVEVKSTA